MRDSESAWAIDYLEEAVDDLDNIIDYYQVVFGVQSAKKVYEQIRASIARLEQFPESGRPIRDRTLRSLGYQERYSKRFVIIYRTDYTVGKIYIYHIADMQRDYPNLYRDEGLS